MKSGSRGATCTPMFITALFTKAKARKQPACVSVMKKMW